MKGTGKGRGAKSPPLGIVFDLDGTLVLSHHDFARMREVVVRTAAKYGVVPERLGVPELVGTSRILDAVRRELHAADVPEGTITQFDAEVSRQLDAVEMEALPRTRARTGGKELLEGLRGRAFRLGLFTRSSEPFCRAVLSHTGLAGFFPHVRTRSAPGPAKPSPDALRLLLLEMAVPAERALFVGDHLEDAGCAARAGVRFYGVLPDPDQPNPTTAEQFLASGAAEVSADLQGIARLLRVT